MEKQFKWRRFAAPLEGMMGSFIVDLDAADLGNKWLVCFAHLFDRVASPF